MIKLFAREAKAAPKQAAAAKTRPAKAATKPAVKKRKPTPGEVMKKLADYEWDYEAMGRA